MGSESLVQGTNDSSILSKNSMVCRGYFEDGIIQYFVSKNVRRSPLINLGYFARAVVVDKSVRKFLEMCPSSAQVLSLGAGFDTTYFRLCESFDKITYYEVDLVEVVDRKIRAIRHSPRLRGILPGMKISEESSSFTSLTNGKYSVFVNDLNDLIGLNNKLTKFGFDFTRPTLVLCECSITYMEENKSTDLIKWIVEKLQTVTFMNYEQINPSDGFGAVMRNHFLKIQNPLKSLSKYPTIEEQTKRYLKAGWPRCEVLSVMELLHNLLTPDEYCKIFKIEPFDEWEEFYLKCCHYTLAIANSNSSTIWSTRSSDVECTSEKTISVAALKDKRLERYAHACVQLSNGGVLIIGGFGLSSNRHHERSNKIVYVGSTQEKVVVDEESTSFACWNCLYCSCTSYGNDEFVIFGGRTSPNRAVNTDPVLVKIISTNDGFKLACQTLLSVGENENRPQPRWRHSMVKLSASLFLFGGRNGQVEVFSDLWELKSNTGKWKWSKIITADISPCGRFSHAAATGDGYMFISGGMDSNFRPLNDVWKLKSEASGQVTWSKINPKIGLGSVFNHSMHWHQGRLILLGGVNCSSDNQPSLAILDVYTLQPHFYSLQGPNPEYELMLHNHTSLFNENELTLYVYGGGGNCFSFGTHFNEFIYKISMDN